MAKCKGKTLLVIEILFTFFNMYTSIQTAGYNGARTVFFCRFGYAEGKVLLCTTINVLALHCNVRNYEACVFCYKRKQFLGSLSHPQSSQALNDKWPTSIPFN